MKTFAIAVLLGSAQASFMSNIFGHHPHALSQVRNAGDDIPPIAADEKSELHDIENELQHETKEVSEDNLANKFLHKGVDQADETNPEVIEPNEDYANEKYKSDMTLANWKTYSQSEQLQLYKQMIYQKNELQAKIIEHEGKIRAYEELTEEVQAEVEKYDAKINKLSGSVTSQASKVE